MTYWFIADIENDYGATYAQLIRAEDLPKVWGKVRGLENTNYPPTENAKDLGTPEDYIEIREGLERIEEAGSKLKIRDDPFREKVQQVLSPLEDLLVAKNEAYGNSALDPVNIFSKSSAVEQIKVRIDDKLSRLYHGKEYGDEDTITDLLGYIVLLKVAEWEADNDAK